VYEGHWFKVKVKGAKGYNDHTSITEYICGWFAFEKQLCVHGSIYAIVWLGRAREIAKIVSINCIVNVVKYAARMV